MLSKCTERREDRQKLSSRDTARERRASRSKCKPLSAWGRRVLQCLAAMTLLLLQGRGASAQGSCQDAFAAWAKLSERHVRITASTPSPLANARTVELTNPPLRLSGRRNVGCGTPVMCISWRADPVKGYTEPMHR